MAEYTNAEIRQRATAIRNATPDILAECCELQDWICDLCGQSIQKELACAALDHSVPVIYFARGPLSLPEAIEQANSRCNLRAAHIRCNAKKNGLPREVWFAKGMDKLVGPAPTLTAEEIEDLKERMKVPGRIGGRKTADKPGFLISIAASGGRVGGKIGGRKNVENKTGICNPIYFGKGGRIGGLIGGRIAASKPGHMAAIGRIGGKTGEKGRKPGFKHTPETIEKIKRAALRRWAFVKSGGIN